MGNADSTVCENLLDKPTGAPGLAFETWDLHANPEDNPGNSNFGKALGADAAMESA